MSEVFSKNSLPVNLDILNGVNYFNNLPKNYHTKMKDVAKLLVAPLIAIWQKTNIPIVTDTAIKSKINKFLEQYKSSRKNKKKEKNFNDSLDKLFNIAKCTCFYSNKTQCECPPSKQIPPTALPFYIDQLNERKLFIETFLQGVAPNTFEDANNNNATTDMSITSTMTINTTTTTDSSDDGTESLYSPDEHEKSQLSVAAQKVIVPKTIRDIDTAPISEAADRFSASNSQVAHLMTSIFEGIGLVNEECKLLVLTSNDVSRFRDRDRLNAIKLRDQKHPAKDLLCFHFDGKRNNNLQMVPTNSSKRATKADNSQSFENIQVVKQPGDVSLGFVKSESGKSKHIFNGLWSFLTKNETQELSNRVRGSAYKCRCRWRHNTTVRRKVKTSAPLDHLSFSLA